MDRWLDLSDDELRERVTRRVSAEFAEAVVNLRDEPGCEEWLVESLGEP